MFIKCIDATCTPRGERLTKGRIYEINERRDVEIALDGTRYYFVNSMRYGGWRFRVVSPVEGLAGSSATKDAPSFMSVSIADLAETSVPWGLNRSPLGPKV